MPVDRTPSDYILPLPDNAPFAGGANALDAVGHAPGEMPHPDNVADELAVAMREKTAALNAELDKPMPAIKIHDPVDHPVHYTSSPACCSKCGHPIECIDVTRHMGFNLGNAMKYLWREGMKNGVEDLRKTVWYVQDEVAKRLGIRSENQFKMTPEEIDLILEYRRKEEADLRLEFEQAVKTR